MSIEITVPGGERRRLLTAGKYCPENIDVTAEGTTFSLIVSVPTGSVVTATKGSLSVSGTASAGFVTLKLPEAGTWSVVATYNGQTSNTKTVSVVDNYAVNIRFASPILNDNEWDVIRSVSDSGEGANYWSVGDRKAVVLNGTVGNLSLSNVTTYAYIIGFNHNSSVEGYGRIHFQLGKTALSGGKDVALCDSKYNSSMSTTGYFSMNSGDTNSGGWASSQMRNNICGTSLSDYSGTIIAVIPTELREVLKSVTKYTNNTGFSTAASAVTATIDYFFLLSEVEYFGVCLNSNLDEAKYQVQYDYYLAGNNRVKYNHIDTETAVRLWLRSPYVADWESFVRVYTDGRASTNGASYAYGFAPGFCV